MIGGARNTTPQGNNSARFRASFEPPITLKFKGNSMLNLFKRPIETETLDSWCKIADDIAKVAILAIPVMLYGNEIISLKVINSLLLLAGAYSSLLISRHLRKNKRGER